MRLPIFLVVLISLSCLPADVRADWPGWSWTSFARWTGYGFSDGYHSGRCRCGCVTGPGVAVPAADCWIGPASNRYGVERPTAEVARWWSAAAATPPPHDTIWTANKEKPPKRPTGPPTRPVGLRR